MENLSSKRCNDRSTKFIILKVNIEFVQLHKKQYHVMSHNCKCTPSRVNKPVRLLLFPFSKQPEVVPLKMNHIEPVFLRAVQHQQS